MITIIECIILCLLFTIMILIMAKDPIKTLYNYPPKIQEKVKQTEEYKDKIPTQKNMILTKFLVSITIIILVSLILRYINGYTNFKESFTSSILIWTIVNIYDVLIIDICWFCHSKRFRFNIKEDLSKEYKNYSYHIKQGLIGQLIGTIICIIISLVIEFIL